MTVARVGVVGAGTMGAQIAQALAAGGIDVILQGKDPEPLALGLRRMPKLAYRAFRPRVASGEMTDDEASALAAEIVSRITGTVTYEGFDDVDLAIETVTEALAAKQRVFQDLDRVTPPSAILASNTSSLSIAEIAHSTRRPENVIGLHWFNPVSEMPLVELVRTPITSGATVDLASDFITHLGRQCVLTDDAPGFIVNRILMAGFCEIFRLQEESGVSPVALDESTSAAKLMPMPTFALVDSLGLALACHVGLQLQQAFGAERFHLHRDLDSLAASGATFIARGEPQIDCSSTDFDRDALIERLTMRWLVEACHIAEGGLASADEIDQAMSAGAGFDPGHGFVPPFARVAGAAPAETVERLERLRAEHGERFAPPAMLR
jgi:3-hydroxyacyl-CoA dehydrogenase